VGNSRGELEERGLFGPVREKEGPGERVTAEGDLQP
jgi:hypothetical protein